MPPPSAQAPPRRGYRSERRARQARQTRERILVAAGAQFESRGYAATRMRTVAEAAGVSVPTVELAFATKPALLLAAIRFAIRGDAEPVPVLARPWAQAARDADSVDAFLAIVGGVLAQAAQRSAGLVVAAFEAAHQDESMSALADQLCDQRAETAGWIVDGLVARGALRAGLLRADAVDTVWLLMDPHGFRALTDRRGWSAERFEVWFVDSVRRLLTPPADPTTPPADPTAAPDDHPKRRTR